MSENYVMLQTVNVGSDQPANITFTNIPSSGYTDLVIKGSTRDTGVNGAIVWTFNGDGTNGNYVAKRVQTQGTAASSDTITRYVAQNGTNETANTFTSWEMYIPNYAAATNHTFLIDSVVENNGSTLNNESSSLTAAYWTGGAPINSIGLTTNAAWATSSVVTLYGISAVGSNPTISPKAMGGDIIKTDGTYWYHAFLSSGTFTPGLNLSCDVMTIAGGGGGFGGGGGAGGFRVLTAQSLATNNYTITVGAGGTGGGNNGINTTVSGTGLTTISATGGGGGGYQGNGVAGGSGGGGGGGLNLARTGGSGNTGSYSPSEGNAGGNAASMSISVGGGGGGAGAVGGNSTSSVPAAGGNGTSAYSSWGNVTGTGQNISGTYWYAGGGSGADQNGSSASGGNGGGGQGDRNPNTGIRNNGLANMGAGGGGGYFAIYGNGGSGIVIIRYAIA
jgi:hypothetical protein